MSDMAPEGGMDQQTYTTVYDVQVQGQQGMNAILEITNQYSAAADNLLGRVAKLNMGLGTMSKHYVGLKPQNAGAVSEAARYQQQLSSLEATVRVSTKGNKAYNETFGELRKNTKALAREMPIGMGQAVQQVDALHQSGVKSNREIKSLAQTYTELGKANAEFGPALGADMQSVNKIYDANIKQSRNYADSLTTVTQKLGGTASGTLSFAKSIAPIAATVGMGESQVIGLSNAFSKMGEDGYGAATAVNKVLLDMNRSIRQGTPEIGNYARLLDMDTSSLTKLFKEKPDEVLTRFTEAIAKKGPDAMQQLDELGLDGVRTVRSIQAVSKGGGLRESIKTAVEGYGSGSTKTGAEQATSGLNDELTKLQETTRQTVEATGRPFLGFLEEIVRLSNAATDAIRGVVDSSAMQGIGKVGAVVGTVGGGVMQVAQLGLMAAFAKRVVGGGMGLLGDARADFRAGRNVVASTAGSARPVGPNEAAAIAEKHGWAARMGGFYGRSAGAGPEPEATRDWRSQARSLSRGIYEGGRRGALGALGVTNALHQGLINDTRAASGKEVPVSPARAAYQEQMRAASERATIQERLVARGAATSSLLGKGMFQDQSFGRALGTTAYTSLVRAPAAGLGFLGGSAGRLGAMGLQGTGRMLGAAGSLGAAGLGALGITAPIAALAGAGYLGYKAYQGHEARAEAADRIQSSVGDPNAAYNDFAAAMGHAGRSTTNFADAAEQAASRLNDINPTKGDAFKISDAEVTQAHAYKGPLALKLSDAEQGKTGIGHRIAMQIVGGWDPMNNNQHGSNDRIDTKALYAKAALTLGNKASKDDIQTMMFDYLAQHVPKGQVQDVANMLKKRYGGEGGTAKPDYALGVQAAYAAQQRSPSSKLSGPSAEAQDAMNETFAGIGQEKERVGSIYGDRSAAVQGYGETNKLMAAYAGQRKKMSSSERAQLDNLVSAGLAGELGMDKKDIKGHLDAGSIGELVKDLKGDKVTSATKQGISDWRTLGSVSGPVTMADLLGVAERPKEPGYEKAAGSSLDASYGQVTGRRASNKEWDEGLHGVASKLFDMGKTFDEGGKALKAGMTPLQRAVSRLESGDVSPATSYRAGSLMAQTELRRYGGNAGMAGLGLTVAAQKISDPNVRSAMTTEGQAYLQNVVQPLQAARQSPVESLRNRIQTGRVAVAQLSKIDTPEAQTAMVNQQADMASAQASMIEMRKQYQNQIIETMRSIKISNEQAQISEGRATEDYQRSRLYAEQDYDTQIYRARRDFGRQMKNAQQDFQKQISRSEDDYQLGRERAQEDYQKSRRRAQEDFQRQQRYSIEDHQRQVNYLLKDAASNMYDPYKRIQAADVMDASGLGGNVREQAAMLRRQSANVKRLKELGLSQRTIDSLDLYNPANAYQAERLVQDIEQDHNAGTQLNSAVAEKDAAAAPLASSSESFRRSEEEFKVGLGRSADQFEVSMVRMETDQRVAMNRMATDQRKAMNRVMADQRIARSRAVQEHRIAMADAAADETKALGRMATAQSTAMERMRADVARSNRLTVEALGRQGKQLTKSAAQIAKESAKAIADAPKAWTGPLVAAVNTMTAALRNELAKVQINASMSFSAPKILGNAQSGYHVAGSNTKFYASGGIAMSPHMGVVAESGYPEAMIPLNHRGAEMMAQVMQRYATSDQTRGVHAQSYANPVNQHQTFTYDYSTRVESVTVVANDPHEMFRQLESIASTKRLVQPAGNQVA